jgi:major membrane immunogen (membrane-anchored lipoprotein)
MKKWYPCVFLLAIAMPASAGVTVTTPSNGATVQSPVHYVATATTSCSKGVSAIGIYTAPYVLAYVVNGASLDTNLTLSAGTYNTVVQEWDNCGSSSTAAIKITVNTGNQTGVYVTSPANNSNVSSPVHYVATATSSCSKGVASMGIYTAPYVLAYSVNGASLDTKLTLSAGTYNTVVQEWDNCGSSATTPITITVGSGGGGGSTFSSLQKGVGWTGYALQPPSFAICNSCKPTGPGTTWAMTQNITSPALSGASSKYDIGGTMVYSDVLWNNHLIGDFSSQGMPDTNHTLVPTLKNFTYDVYFYGTNLELSQALEFDINQFFNGLGFIWGHECRIAGGHEWDTWDNTNQKWVPTGVACNPVSNSWNHLVIQVQRTSDNRLLFQSITLNGVPNNLNVYRNPGSAVGWYGITVNWQIDGNSKQNPYTVYLDNFNFTYQ